MSVRIVLLAPGASGNPASVKPFAAGLNTVGADARIVALPKGTIQPPPQPTQTTGCVFVGSSAVPVPLLFLLLIVC